MPKHNPKSTVSAASANLPKPPRRIDSGRKGGGGYPPDKPNKIAVGGDETGDKNSLLCPDKLRKSWRKRASEAQHDIHQKNQDLGDLRRWEKIQRENGLSENAAGGHSASKGVKWIFNNKPHEPVSFSIKDLTQFSDIGKNAVQSSAIWGNFAFLRTIVAPFFRSLPWGQFEELLGLGIITAIIRICWSSDKSFKDKVNAIDSMLIPLNDVRLKFVNWVKNIKADESGFY